MREEIKFSGNWKVLDKEYSGDLYIIQSKGIIRLVLFYKDNIREIIQKNYLPYRIKLITGVLIGGGKITLLNCTIMQQSSDFSRRTTTIVIDCEYCINGLDFKNYESVKFCQMDFRLSKTIVWSELSGFEYGDFSRKTPLKLKYSFKRSIKCNLENNFKLEIAPVLDGINYDGNIEKINLGQHIIFKFINRKEIHFFEFIKLLEKMKELVEIGIRDTVDIISIEGYKKSVFSTHYDLKGKIHKNKYPIEIFFKGKVKEEYEEPKVNNILFFLHEIENNSIENWFKKNNSLKPIIEQYIECIKYDTVSPEKRFLCIMQALESYHYRFICKDKKEFYDRVDKLYNNEEVKSYIKDKEQDNADYILFKNRIVDLILQSQLLWRFSPLNRCLYFTNSVTNSRHYYTHFDESKRHKAMTDLELEEACYIVTCLLENYFLYELNVDKTIIGKKMQDYLSRIQRNIKLLKDIDIEKEIVEKICLETEIEKLGRILCYNYDLGEFESITFKKESKKMSIDCILVANGEQYTIRIFNEKKSDEDCSKKVDDMIKKKIKVIRTRGGDKVYILDYFTTRYRFCVFKEK